MYICCPSHQNYDVNRLRPITYPQIYSTNITVYILHGLHFRFIVRIDSWKVDSQYPNGHFVRALGPIGDLKTELAAILVEYQVASGQFSEGQVSDSAGRTQVNLEPMSWNIFWKYIQE